MNYHQRMLPVCNCITQLLTEEAIPKAILEQALTHLVEERPFQALELVSQRKLKADFQFEKLALAKVEEELAMAIISHAQKLDELKRVVKIASLSIENKMVLWARAAGLKYQAPIPIKGE